MIHSLKVMVATTSAVAAAVPAAGQDRPAERKEPEITVTGTGMVTLSPDYAMVQVSVVTRDGQAARAGEQNARETGAVRAALRRLLGTPDDSLPTVSYSVDADYDRGRPVGYAARSALEVRVRDLSRVGAVIDAALGAGATNISQVRFESTRRESARLEALAKAVQAARREAESIARAAGGRLGPLLSVSSSGPVMFTASAMRAQAMAAPETPVAPPVLEVTATVTTRWAFVPE
jgi:uncharacterized protein YggE